MKEENITYLFENIISKAKYNEQLGKWEIKEVDYVNLNLSTNQKKLLKKMCENLDIELEYKGYTRDLLPCVIDETLFQEYNEIKSKLKLDPTSHELIQQKIKIRNKIVSDNLEFVRSILNRRLDGINDMEEKEDIYQIGYEILLKYVDKNYLNKDTFKNNISKILMLYTSRRILFEKEGIGHYKKKQVSSLIGLQLPPNSKELEELSKQLHLKRKVIEELFALKNIIDATSLEERTAVIDKVLENNNIPLYYDNFEEQIIEKISQREIVLKIISTLPKQQREIISLYFGFNNGISYTMEEIANMYGLTKNRISAIINKAITTIKETTRISFLKQVYDSKDIHEDIDLHQEKKLEVFLLCRLPQYIYDKVYKEIHSSVQRQLFAIMHQNPEYGAKEIGEKLNKTIPQVHAMKDKIIIIIREILMEYLKEYGYLTYEDYLECLMNLYICNGKIRKRKKS